MALDPQVKAVIELAIKAGRPPYHTLSPKDARLLFLETRPFSTPAAPAIGTVRNLAAEGPAGQIPLRLYRPAGVPDATPLPAYVYFHGGGWVIGDLESHDVLCRQLTAESGACVIAVDYRLAPEHKFPAAADDAWAATRGSWRMPLSRAWTRAGGGGRRQRGRETWPPVVAREARATPAHPRSRSVLIYPVPDLGTESKSYDDSPTATCSPATCMRWFTAHYSGKRRRARTGASPRSGRRRCRASRRSSSPPASICCATRRGLRHEAARWPASAWTDVSFGGMIHGFVGMGAC